MANCRFRYVEQERRQGAVKKNTRIQEPMFTSNHPDPRPMSKLLILTSAFALICGAAFPTAAFSKGAEPPDCRKAGKEQQDCRKAGKEQQDCRKAGKEQQDCRKAGKEQQDCRKAGKEQQDCKTSGDSQELSVRKAGGKDPQFLTGNAAGPDAAFGMGDGDREANNDGKEELVTGAGKGNDGGIAPTAAAESETHGRGAGDKNDDGRAELVPHTAGKETVDVTGLEIAEENERAVPDEGNDGIAELITGAGAGESLNIEHINLDTKNDVHIDPFESRNSLGLTLQTADKLNRSPIQIPQINIPTPGFVPTPAVVEAPIVPVMPTRSMVLGPVR
jgi:hypothetical protein